MNRRDPWGSISDKTNCFCSIKLKGRHWLFLLGSPCIVSHFSLGCDWVWLSPGLHKVTEFIPPRCFWSAVQESGRDSRWLYHLRMWWAHWKILPKKKPDHPTSLLREPTPVLRRRRKDNSEDMRTVTQIVPSPIPRNGGGWGWGAGERKLFSLIIAVRHPKHRADLHC